MLYNLAHFLRAHCSWIWTIFELVNAWLFVLRYAHKLPVVIAGNIVPLTVERIEALAQFFKRQPEDAFIFFRPHAFDVKTLHSLVRNKAFLAYLVIDDNGEIIGYFFLRCFFWGKCYRGYMTDYAHRRQGINRLMGIEATKIARHLHLRMFGSIAPNNVASMKSAQAVNDIRIIKVLRNGDYLVEYLPKS